MAGSWRFGLFILAACGARAVDPLPASPDDAGGTGDDGGGAPDAGAPLCPDPDVDRDGYHAIECGGLDCDDSDDRTHPDASEGGGGGIWRRELVAFGEDPAVVVGADFLPHVFFHSPAGVYVASRGESGLFESDRIDAFDTRAVEAGLGPDGEAHALYVGGSDLRVAVEEAGGWTHESLPVGSNGSSAAIVVDGDFVAHAASCHGDGTWHEEDSGGDWEAESIELLPCDAASIALGPDDGLHVATIAGGALRYAARTDGTWSASPVETGDGDPLDVAIAVGADGVVTIVEAVTIGASREVRSARSDGAGWTVESIAASPTLEDDVSVAIDPEGTPHAVYVDAGDLVHATRSETGWSSEPIVNGVGARSSLAIDPEGWVHVAYEVDAVYFVSNGPRRDGIDRNCDGRDD